MEIVQAKAVPQRKERSPNFPFISIQTALERAQALYDAEKRSNVALPVLAKHWNYSSKSSGLAQTIAALKSYGLIEDEGRGPTRRIRLSPSALRILLDDRPSSEERLYYLQQAVQLPPFVKKIMEKHPNDRPSADNLRHTLIFDLHFTPEAAKEAAKIFFENDGVAELYDGGTLQGSDEETQEPSNMNRSVGIEIPRSYPAELPRLGLSGGTTASMKTERIIGPNEIPIIMQFGGEPSWEIYDFLENYIKLRKSILKQGASGAESKEKDK